MTTHAEHTIHANSRISFAALNLGERRALVMAAYFLAGVPLTDREVLARLGLTDMNDVRPRITTLRDEGLLMETGSVTCCETGKRVRVCEPTSLARKGAQ
jgi:hypothetical protein